MTHRQFANASISFVLLAASMLLTLVMAGGATSQATTTAKEVIGRWQGKFPLPEDSTLRDAENPVAVEVNVKDEGGKLFGSVTFYVIRNKDNKPQVVGQKQAEMIAPVIDGKRLNFSVKSKGQQPGTETTVDMRVTVISAVEAELENLEDSSSPVFKLKKVQ